MGAGKSKQKLKKKQRDELQEKTHMSDEDIMAWHRGKGYILNKNIIIYYIFIVSLKLSMNCQSLNRLLFFYDKSFRPKNYNFLVDIIPFEIYDSKALDVFGIRYKFILGEMNFEVSM